MGFTLAYIDLLQSIAENDTRNISDICEKNLYREFYSGLQELNFNFKSVEVLNLSDDMEENMKNIDMKVLDYYSYFGADVDREKNRQDALINMQSDRKKFIAFTP